MTVLQIQGEEIKLEPPMVKGLKRIYQACRHGWTPSTNHNTAAALARRGLITHYTTLTNPSDWKPGRASASVTAKGYAVLQQLGVAISQEEAKLAKAFERLEACRRELRDACFSALEVLDAHKAEVTCETPQPPDTEDDLNRLEDLLCPPREIALQLLVHDKPAYVAKGLFEVEAQFRSGTLEITGDLMVALHTATAKFAEDFELYGGLGRRLEALRFIASHLINDDLYEEDLPQEVPPSSDTVLN